VDWASWRTKPHPRTRVWTRNTRGQSPRLCWQPVTAGSQL